MQRVCKGTLEEFENYLYLIWTINQNSSEERRNKIIRKAWNESKIDANGTYYWLTEY